MSTDKPRDIVGEATSQRLFDEAMAKAAARAPKSGRPPTSEEIARSAEEAEVRRLAGRKTLSPLNDGGNTGTRVRAKHLGETHQRELHPCDLAEDSCEGRRPKPEGGKSLFDKIEGQRGINNFRWR